MKIKVLITGRNNPEWTLECVKSCYDSGLNDVMLCDDASDYASVEVLQKHIGNIPVIWSGERGGPYVSRMKLLNKLYEENEDDETIILLLDADDYIRRNDLKKLIEEEFTSDFDILSLCNAGDNWSNYTDKKIKEYQKNKKIDPYFWPHVLIPHMRMFKFKIFKKLKSIDPEFNIGKTKEGKFVTAGTDFALLNPMVFITLPERIKIKMYEDRVHFYRVHGNMTHSDKTNVTNRDIFVDLINKYLKDYV